MPTKIPTKVSCITSTFIELKWDTLVYMFHCHMKAPTSSPITDVPTSLVSHVSKIWRVFTVSMTVVDYVLPISILYSQHIPQVITLQRSPPRGQPRSVTWFALWSNRYDIVSTCSIFFHWPKPPTSSPITDTPTALVSRIKYQRIVFFPFLHEIYVLHSSATNFIANAHPKW